jgi:hypothetical protein
MIAKRIPRQGDSSFRRLAQYLARGEPGEQVVGLQITNCASDTPEEAVAEILHLQNLNTRAKGDKTYHLVISFPPGERPTAEQLQAIEADLVAAIGLAEHQRMSAVHTDTEHLHVHVAINKIHPETLRYVEPYFDKLRLMEACTRLELQHGLERTPHGIELDAGRDHAHQQEQSHDRYAGYDIASDRHRAVLRQSYDSALAEDPEAQSLNVVRSLSGVGVVRFGEGREVLLSRDAPGDVEHGRSERADALRRQGHGRSGGDRQGGEGSRLTAAIPERAAAMEIHAGVESFARYAGERVAAHWPAITAAASWEQLHATLGEAGLVLQQRGAGLVLGDAGGMFHVKASTANRALSLGQLQKRLGPWRAGPAVATKGPPSRPLQQGAQATGLFTSFNAQRSAAQAARRRGRDAVQAEQKAHTSALYAWRDRRRHAIRHSRDLSPAAKAHAYSQLRVEFESQLAASRQEFGLRRAQLLEANPLPAWQPWLVERAGQGDGEALQVLRSRQDRIDKRAKALLRAGNADALRQILRPASAQGRVLRDGSIAYDPGDGGRIFDTAEGVQLRGQGVAAAWLALELASKRYEGQALTVAGDQDLRLQLAELAALRGLRITFSDADLEQRRRDVAGLQRLPIRPAVARFVTRNQVDAKNAKISGIDYYRVADRADSGQGIYRGLATLDDGTAVALVDHARTRLVLPLSQRQAAAFREIPKDSPVSLANGHMEERSVKPKTQGQER